MLGQLLKPYKAQLLYGLVSFVTIILLFSFFSTGVIWIDSARAMTLLLFNTTVYYIIMKRKFPLKTVLLFCVKTYSLFTIFLWVNYYLLSWGVWGFWLLIILLAGYRMWKQRVFLGQSKRGLEKMIFGRELGNFKHFREKWRR